MIIYKNINILINNKMKIKFNMNKIFLYKILLKY